MSGEAQNPSPDAFISFPPDAIELPPPPGLVPLPPCTTCGTDMCGHEREFPNDPGGPPRVGITVPADGVMRAFDLRGERAGRPRGGPVRCTDGTEWWS